MVPLTTTVKKESWWISEEQGISHQTHSEWLFVFCKSGISFQLASTAWKHAGSAKLILAVQSWPYLDHPQGTCGPVAFAKLTISERSWPGSDIISQRGICRPGYLFNVRPVGCFTSGVPRFPGWGPSRLSCTAEFKCLLLQGSRRRPFALKGNQEWPLGRPRPGSGYQGQRKVMQWSLIWGGAGR